MLKEAKPIYTIRSQDGGHLWGGESRGGFRGVMRRCLRNYHFITDL